MGATKLLVASVLLGAAGVLLTAPFEAADARSVFQCKGSIIEPGLTIPEVLAKCGEPEWRDVEAVPIRARAAGGGTYVVGTTSIEHWVYERRPGQFPAYLTFDQGELRSIEFMDRP